MTNFIAKFSAAIVAKVARRPLAGNLKATMVKREYVAPCLNCMDPWEPGPLMEIWSLGGVELRQHRVKGCYACGWW